MKFLDPRFEGRNIMPLQVISYDCFELGARDALAVVFKDMTTGQKFVQNIERPKYEVWVLKKEYWDQVRIIEAWERKDKCNRYVISYHYRDRELANILGCDPKDVKYSPLIFGYDVSIESFYWIHFLLEYHNDETKKLSMGFFDIESDIIQVSGKTAEAGSCPTTAITFIDCDRRHVYTMCLLKDNLPIYAESHPRYRSIEDVRKKFYDQVAELKDDVPGFIEELHRLFDPSYGELQYDLILFEDEIRLHKFFWELVRASNIDILEAWNAPYDVRNLIERPLVLGYEPESIICDPAFTYQTCFFEEDTNVQPHKRNHRVAISVKFLILCQMWMYAGLRVAQGKQSLKLQAVAQKEIKDEKLNYEEEGSIKTFMYKNLRKYWIYNIKDVLLLMGIYWNNQDADAIYDRGYDAFQQIGECFVSTSLLTNYLMAFFYQEGYVLGTNANRILPPFDYTQYLSESTPGLADIDQMLQEAADYDPDGVFFDDDFEEEGEDFYGDDEG